MNSMRSIAIGSPRLPIPGCDRGTGEEVRDLRRDVRLEWWTQHRSAITVPIFSIVAVPKADRVSPILKQTYAKLAGIDPRNDGVILWYDAMVNARLLAGICERRPPGHRRSRKPTAPGAFFPVQRQCSTHSTRKSGHRSRR